MSTGERRPDSVAHPRQETGAALYFQDVTKRFQPGGRQVSALQHVTLEVRQGLVTGLIGPDGAGKTTLMRLAAALMVPDEGHVMVLGIDATQSPLAVQSAIGYMPQRFGLYEDLTVQENLDLYADLQGLPHLERQPRYDQLTRMTGLASFTSRLAGRLSGGMKQKLGLACTLVRPPRLLLLDEPTVGVDPVSRRELWNIVYGLVQEEGMSVLLSTAYMDEAERCHEVVLLHEGKILGQDTPERFRSTMQGLTFQVTVPTLNKRTVQEILSQLPDVTDAVIQGDHVRVVMDTPSPPDGGRLFPDDPNTTIVPVPPRLEDRFMSMLKIQPLSSQARSIPSPDSLTTERHADSTSSVIHVHDAQRQFGEFYAVNHISFEVRRGEVFGLLGANGAGKSTTFRMLCGLLPPSGGELTVAGVDLRKAASAARAHIGYMSQKFSLYGNLSVLQNLRFFSSAYGLSGIRRKTRTTWALEQFDLVALSDAMSGDLPLGFKQRLALACALMHEPDILFLDEPTSGVDPLARREFWHRINVLAEQGVTVLVTTHFIEEAEYCDRIAIMVAGRILTIGEPTEIKAHARTADTPDPTLEDAFIALIESQQQEGAVA